MSKKKNMLHEILAVIGDLKGTKDKIFKESIKTFTDRDHHFKGMNRKLEMFDESRAGEETEEHKAMVTTVHDKLEYTKKSFIRFWDAKLMKERGNQEAKGDIVVGDITIATDVPVTLLLEMENEMKELRKMYDSIPTLEAGVDWVKADDIGPNTWKTKHPVTANRTERVTQHKIIVPPTDRHPAQVREWNEDKAIGRYTTINWSGMITPAEKSVLLERLDQITRAIKKARQRANKQEVQPAQFGSAIFGFIHQK